MFQSINKYLPSSNIIEQLEFSAVKNTNSMTNPPKIHDDFVHGKLLQQNTFSSREYRTCIIFG